MDIMICVEISIGPKEIRVITGYGPQETWNDSERLPFFVSLEEGITKAEIAGKSVLIAMDANCKMGPNMIIGDPHEQTSNGKLLSEIISRDALIVANNLNEKCTGKITRERQTKNGWVVVWNLI